MLRRNSRGPWCHCKTRRSDFQGSGGSRGSRGSSGSSGSRGSRFRVHRRRAKASVVSALAGGAKPPGQKRSPPEKKAPAKEGRRSVLAGAIQSPGAGRLKKNNTTTERVRPQPHPPRPVLRTGIESGAAGCACSARPWPPQSPRPSARGVLNSARSPLRPAPASYSPVRRRTGDSGSSGRSGC